MEMVFYLLWIIAFLRVTAWPTVRFVVKICLTFAIFLGFWLIIGAAKYQAAYAQYQSKAATFETRKTAFSHEEKRLQELYKLHPTSRDIVIRLAQIAFQTGEHSQFLRYVDELKSIDPNNPKFQQLLQSVQ